MIPGILISILTFPGIIVHEISHLLCCRMLGIKVHKVCYFRLGNPAGYVAHDLPNALQQILIGFGPFFVNTTVGLLLGLTSGIARHRFGVSLISWPMILLPWLTVSVAMHAFPSTGDARSIWRSLWARETSWPVRILGMPLVLAIYAGALASVFWLDVGYGVAVLWLALRIMEGTL